MTVVHISISRKGKMGSKFIFKEGSKVVYEICIPIPYRGKAIVDDVASFLDLYIDDPMLEKLTAPPDTDYDIIGKIDKELIVLNKIFVALEKKSEYIKSLLNKALASGVVSDWEYQCYLDEVEQ